MAGLLQLPFHPLLRLLGQPATAGFMLLFKILPFGNDELIHESLSSWKCSGQQKSFLSLVQRGAP